MRLVLLALAATACATAPCTLEACAGVCPDVGTGARAVLAPWMLEGFAPDIADLRAGAQFQGEAKLCRPDSRCADGALDLSVPLPPVPYDLYVDVRTPRIGWEKDLTGTYTEWCATPVAGAQESIERPYARRQAANPPHTPGEWTTWMFHRIDPSPFQKEQRCVWELEITDPNGASTKLEGRFDLQAPSRAELAEHGIPVAPGTPNVEMTEGPATP